MIGIVEAVACGVAFGFLLQKAGLTQYARIVNVYRLSDLAVMEFMLAALLFGAVLVQAGLDLGFASTAPVPKTAVLANLAGGVIFGVGMATAGYCPGTIVAEAGEGRLDAALAGLAGLVTGALVFGLLQPVLMPVLARVAVLGSVTFAQLLGASPWLVLLVFAELVLLVLVAVARSGKRRGDDERAIPGAIDSPG
jgi:hypothetical protein